MSRKLLDKNSELNDELNDRMSKRNAKSDRISKDGGEVENSEVLLIYSELNIW